MNKKQIQAAMPIFVEIHDLDKKIEALGKIVPSGCRVEISKGLDGVVIVDNGGLILYPVIDAALEALKSRRSQLELRLTEI